MSNPAEIFRQQLNLIHDADIKSFTEIVLYHTPSYFMEMPASTSGKYHPVYSLGEGGLVRHTKAAVKIADCLLGLEMYNSLLPSRDLIIAALILHDSVKNGKNGGQYSVIEHPLDAADLVIETAKSISYAHMDKAEAIAGMVRSHMGQWNTDRYGFEILPKPATKEQKFVHQCDYLASRKFITIEELD